MKERLSSLCSQDPIQSQTNKICFLTTISSHILLDMHNSIAVYHFPESSGKGSVVKSQGCSTTEHQLIPQLSYTGYFVED